MPETEPLTAERLAAIEADLDAAWSEAGETSPVVARAVNGSYILLSRYQRLLAALAASEKIARDNGFALARQAPTVARARDWLQRAETAEAEVARLTAEVHVLTRSEDGRAVFLEAERDDARAEVARLTAEREYVPTLVERLAEAIPTELTATPHVGVGGARRAKIAAAVLPVVEAELARTNAKLSHLADLHRAEQNARYAAEAEVQRCGEANRELSKLYAEACRKLDAVRMLKVWTNEDGKRFVFADELWTATDPDVNPTPAALSPTVQAEGDWLVWSNEHSAWWGPGGRAYRADAREAGRYDQASAEHACTLRTWEQGTIPPEVMIRRPSNEVMASPDATSVLCKLVSAETVRRIAERKAAAAVVAEATQAECRRCGGGGEMTAPHGFVAVCGRCGGTGKDPAAPDAVPAAAADRPVA